MNRRREIATFGGGFACLTILFADTHDAPPFCSPAPRRPWRPCPTGRADGRLDPGVSARGTSTPRGSTSTRSSQPPSLSACRSSPSAHTFPPELRTDAFSTCFRRHTTESCPHWDSVRPCRALMRHWYQIRPSPRGRLEQSGLLAQPATHPIFPWGDPATSTGSQGSRRQPKSNLGAIPKESGSVVIRFP